MIDRNAHDRRQRRILIGLALMFFAPLGLSFYLYYGKSWRPGGRVNAGELITPPRPLPSLALPLAGTTGTGQRHQPVFAQQELNLLDFVLAPDERRQAP